MASKQMEIKIAEDKVETQRILDQLRAVARSKPDETVMALEILAHRRLTEKWEAGSEKWE